MRPLRSAAAVLAVALATVASSAQSAEARAQAFEEHEQWSEAAVAYREALAASPTSLGALLGLERVYDQLGMRDSILPVIARAVEQSPRDPSLRGIQLREVRATQGRAAARDVYEQWRLAAPGDLAPFRAYARILLADNDPRAADSVLKDAERVSGGARELAYETAMLRASLGRWESAAQAWHDAVGDRPYFAQAAAFSLLPTPAAQRAAVIAALEGKPVTVGARSVIAQMQLAWGEPRLGWDALRDLRADSDAVTAWRDYADRAEAAGAWLVARDALVAAALARHDGELMARGAQAALRAGDARGADTLAARAASQMDSAFAAGVAVPVRVDALSVLGRGAEAEQVAAAYSKWITPDERAAMARRVAWAWLRAGDIPRARAALKAAGPDAGDASGWLALYDGDLAAARTLIPPDRAHQPDELTAAALLGRTTRARAPVTGAAFLALARGDSAKAARGFESAAGEVPEAASLLLDLSARIRAAQGDDAAAIALWSRVVAESPQSPEAPSSDLAWARALRRAHRDNEAIVRLEHLILTYPESALVPQARRELDAAHQALPSTS